MKVARAIAEILKREGVEFLVSYPVNPIIEACAEADIRTIVVRQERVGLHMADAYSRLNSGRRIGVFAMQHGLGAENAFGGVAQAYGESVPILVLPAGYPRRLAQVPPNFSSALNFRHVTKWSEQLSLAEAVPEVMRRAFARLRNGRPRPVLIEIPVDLFSEEAPEPLDYAPSFATRSGPDPAAVAGAAEILAGAERPVLYAGQGVHYARAWGELRELAELLNAPVTTSLQGKSAFPEDHPLSLGVGNRSMPEAVRRFLDDADVIFGVGCSFTTTGFGVRMPQGKTVIHATLDPGDLNKDLPVQHALLGDAQLVLRALLGELEGRPLPTAEGRHGVAQDIRAINGPWLESWLPRLTSDEVPLSPYRVIWDLMHTVDLDETIITHDAGSPRDQLAPFWQSRTPLSYIGWGKTTQLGYGLGLAMVAKLARPDKLWTPPSASPGWTSRQLSGSVSLFSRSSSTTSQWRSSCRSCRSPPKSTAAPTSQGTMPLWPGPSEATVSRLGTPPILSRRFAGASPRPVRVPLPSSSSSRQRRSTIPPSDPVPAAPLPT